MYLVQGTKEWVFYDRQDYAHLYPDVATAQFHVDPFKMGGVDLDQFPLYAKTKGGYRAVQQPGDLVFIPVGCPHIVRNLDAIVCLVILVNPQQIHVYMITIQLHKHN